jgi:hypothetical protein
MGGCPECYNDPNWKFWRDTPMNPEIKKKLTVLPPKQYYLSLDDALKAWGQEITDDDLDKGTVIPNCNK